MSEIKILSAPNQATPPPDIRSTLERALELGIDVIASPGTTNDFGPYYLGSGTQAHSRESFKNSVRPYLRLASEHKIPFIFSVGLAGGRVHLNESLNRMREVCEEDGLDFRIGVIDTEISHETLHTAIEGCRDIRRAFENDALSPQLCHDDVDLSERVVGLLGPEPIGRKLAQGDLDGIVTGRAFDSALFMAAPLARGIPIAVAGHAGKILEVCGLALDPPDGRQPTWARLDDGGFEIRSVSNGCEPTVESVVGGTYYERSDSGLEVHPGGTLDMRDCKYEKSGGSVYCSGARWHEKEYTLLIEGAALVGYRAIVPIGVREPALLETLDRWLDRMQSELDERGRSLGIQRGTNFELSVRVYGLNGVLGSCEPERYVTGHEAGLIVDSVAESQEMANEFAFFAWERLFGTSYQDTGQRRAGGCAIPFSPIPIPVGAVYRYNIYHILPVADPMEPFQEYELELTGRRSS